MTEEPVEIAASSSFTFRNSIAVKEAHKVMAENCIAVWKYGGIKYEDESYKYCIDHWAQHFRDAQTFSIVDGQVNVEDIDEKFWDTYLAVWNDREFIRSQQLSDFIQDHDSNTYNAQYTDEAKLAFIATFGHYRLLDFELRGDAEILPRFGGNLRAFYLALRDQALIDERRTCYVALTRARRALVVTGAHWYGDDTQKPKPPSEFFDDLAVWAAESALGSVERDDPCADANPLFGYRERFVTDWPGPARRDEADDVFPTGWRQAAHAARHDPDLPARVAETLAPDERSAYEGEARQLRLVAATLIERERAARPAGVPPSPVSVSGIAEYLECPKRFYWSYVRPLPRFSGPAARLGTQIHAWIERRGSGQATLLELDEEPDLTAEELAGAPGKLERLQQAFMASRFARAVPLYAERPFLLSVGTSVIGGRIDAVFGTADGSWEIVDYKSGRIPAADDPLARLQLDVYALACIDVFGKRAGDLTLTYFYLASGQERSWRAGDPEETRARVRAALDDMAAGRFEPFPGERCEWCDFTSFCSAGQAYLADRSRGEGGSVTLPIPDPDPEGVVG